MIEIIYESALQALKDAVAGKGEGYVYQPIGGACVYVHEGEPSCLDGHALARLGVPLEELERCDRKGDIVGSMDAKQAINFLAQRGVATADRDAMTLLVAAQDYQDGHTSWGLSLEYAVDEVESGIIDY